MGKMIEDMDNVIAELKKQGVSHDVNTDQVVGLGDIVESALNKFGITQERFKHWFNLQSCNCTERKKYLNNLFSWHVKKNIDKTE